MDVLWIGNDHTIKVTGLRDEISGGYFNGADVTAVIKTQSGVVVATITLAYVAASNGDYQGTIDDGVLLVNDKFYIVEVSADAGGGLMALWRKELPARYRDFGE